jgi:CubicO group peptidase (beta-lactamase class C family)
MKFLIFAILIPALLWSEPAEKASPKIIFPTKEWKVVQPAAQNMDSMMLLQADMVIRTTQPAIRGILVSRNGQIVFQKYYGIFNGDSLFNIWSLTKSVMSTLVGIALQRKEIDSLQQKVYTLMPPQVVADVNESVKEVTVNNLLNMTSGFSWNRPGTKEPMNRYEEIDKIFASPTSSKPGVVFAYDGANSHAISLMLNKVTGIPADRYAEKHLFKQLGIKNYQWERDKAGNPLGSEGLHLNAKELAKIGYLYLRNGKWENKQILPADYIQKATTIQNKGGSPGNDGYGFFWWVGAKDTYYGLGTGGQVLAVTPSLGLVTVIISDPNNPHADLNKPKQIIYDYVIAAAK